MKAPYVVLFVGSLVTFLGGAALAIFAFSTGVIDPWTGVVLGAIGAIGAIVGARELWGSGRNGRRE